MGVMLLKDFCSGEMSLSESLMRVVISHSLGCGGDLKVFYSCLVKSGIELMWIYFCNFVT